MSHSTRSYQQALALTLLQPIEQILYKITLPTFPENEKYTIKNPHKLKIEMKSSSSALTLNFKLFQERERRKNRLLTMIMEQGHSMPAATTPTTATTTLPRPASFNEEHCVFISFSQCQREKLL